jgi:hypothetical protein
LKAGALKLTRFVVLFCTFICALHADEPYHWESTQVDDSAQLLTLFSQDVPLVSVLRDKLGHEQISYLWLLTYSRATVAQRTLSAVPFFYWKVGSGSDKVKKTDLKPLMNLSLPQRTVVPSTFRNIIQWTILDPFSTPLRASSRAYQNNRHDHELLHLEEAESYLQSAPSAYLTDDERDTIIARLELRKSLLGDFVSAGRAASFGQNAVLAQERICAKNWELLRQCADKTGLVFQPLNLAGTKNEYAMLWAPAHWTAPWPSARLGPVWKLLNIKEPQGEREKIPLGVYSLTYPKMPLLMIDFRNSAHLKWHELTQRSITEITSGVIGISRFANWYYYVAADLYHFYASRRGTATNQQQRLDCYSKFRVALERDQNLEPALRADMLKRVSFYSVNPLETSAKKEFQAAVKRYDLLQANPPVKLLNKDRRIELARYEATTEGQQVRGDLLHYCTFGLYTRHATGPDVLDRLALYREVEYDLGFLDKLSVAGTPPEVAYDSTFIRGAVSELALLLPDIQSPLIRARAQQAIQKLQNISADSQLRAQCLEALDSLHGATTASGLREGSGTPETLR